ncbi:MAG: MarR family transcriptional regulator, organic hydroperoxide resistance regulator [Thermotogaceae bacterium]|jgi:DNA-binding MarR family transcriptional regulator|nr:MarR family transcriptional regulator, organic hydroperoxide resistance regulator [Thermotogaceae bacterium]MDN5337543.1 MarR family transcriptional regulator, organic hydroperoxide resistance regulator [Thermotogaceae bacterium]
MYEELEILLRRLCFSVKVAGRKVLRDFDITPSQFDMLQKLFFKGEMRLTDLSEELGITKGTASGIIKRLVDYGYVKKVKSQVDKRVYNLSITDEGRKVIEEVINKRVEYIRNIFSVFDESKKKSFLEQLKQLTNIIENK